MSFSSLKKSSIEYGGGIYSINEYSSIRVSVGYTSFLDPDEAKTYSLSQWNSLAIYVFPKKWIEHIIRMDVFPYTHHFSGRVSIPDGHWVVMRILRNKFGKPARATVAWFQFNSQGKAVTIKHKEAELFYLKGFTLNRVYKRGKEPLLIEYQRERKIWW